MTLDGGGARGRQHRSKRATDDRRCAQKTQEFPQRGIHVTLSSDTSFIPSAAAA
jgi:hypothetical protein